MPTHNKAGGIGAAVACAKKGNGTVKAMYRLNSVILIKGERRNIEGAAWDVEILSDTDTDQSECVLLTYYVLNSCFAVEILHPFQPK